MTSEHREPKDWDALYVQNRFPWDLGVPAPPLGAALKLHKHLLPPPTAEGGSRSLAYVPGCGNGHDVFQLAEHGYQVVGADVSPTVIGRNHEKLASHPLRPFITFVQHDFFSHEGSYDLVFDYTFFCAFPPSERPRWARQMQRVLKVGGVLICLMFPMEDKEGGPPFGVSEEGYKEVLLENGFEWVTSWKAENSVEARRGREAVALFRKVRD